MISRFERFSFLITQTYRSLRRIAATEMEKYGLKGSSAYYLSALGKYEEGLTCARLSELSGKNKADVSREINAMIKKGLVSRMDNGGSTYRAAIVLTDAGKAAKDRIERIAALAVRSVSRGIPKESISIFYDVIEKISENMSMMSQTGINEADE